MITYGLCSRNGMTLFVYCRQEVMHCTTPPHLKLSSVLTNQYDKADEGPRRATTSRNFHISFPNVSLWLVQSGLLFDLQECGNQSRQFKQGMFCIFFSGGFIFGRATISCDKSMINYNITSRFTEGLGVTFK